MSYTQIDFLLTPYIYNGEPLVGGTAEFYESGTTTPYTVYVDNEGNGGSTVRSFESDGTIVAYSDGSSDIKVIIKDSDGSVLNTYDGLFVDRVGDLSGKVDKAGDTMNGDLNMGSNDITNGGDIIVGDDKTFIASHGGSIASTHPDDFLYIATTSGNHSLRGGSSLGVYDDGTLALSISDTNVVATGDITISNLSGNTGELTTLDANGKVLASGTTLSSINTTIQGLSGDYVNKSGDTMSGTLNMDNNTIENVSVIETVGLFLTNSGSTIYSLNEESGVFEISDSTATRQFSIDSDEVSVESKKITNVADGVDPNDAVNKSQLDNLDLSSYLALTGGTLTGDLRIVGTERIYFRNTINTSDRFSLRYNSGTDGVDFLDDAGTIRLGIKSAGINLNSGVISNVGNASSNGDAVNLGQMVDYVADNAGSSLSAVYIDDDVSNSSTTNAFTISATGVGDTDYGARVILEITINDPTNNYSYATIEMTRPVGSSTFYYVGSYIAGYRASLVPSGLSRAKGSNSFATSTTFFGFDITSSINYATDVSATVSTNSILFSIDRTSGTPASWTQQQLVGKVEIFS